MPVRETGLYYLQSRYYNPTWGRFINADGYTSTGQGMLGNNMFAYCLNNPANRYDPSGMCGICVADKKQDQIMTSATCDFGGGGGGGVGAGIAAAAVIVATTVAQNEEVKAEAVALSQTSFEPYTVYFLCKKDDVGKTIIYVGRVKTANFDARMSYHKSRGRKLVKKIDGLNYEACRAIEQAGMIYYHTINRESSINNKIRGVGPHNANRLIYMEAMWEIIIMNMYTGENCIPASYILNLTEEMFLNGTP